MKRFGRYGCGGLLAVFGLLVVINLFSSKRASPSAVPTFTPTKTPLTAVVNRSLQVQAVTSPTIELLPTSTTVVTPMPAETPAPSVATVAMQISGVTLDVANLREGPGTSYAVAGSINAGQTVTIINKNETSDWYQLDSKAWIAAFLVDISGQRDSPAAGAVVREQTATPAATNCDSAYPDFCIPPLPVKSTCKDIGRNNFTVLAPDPQRFDRDGDGVGCEK